MVKCSKKGEFPTEELESFDGPNDSENDTSDFMKGMEEAEGDDDDKETECLNDEFDDEMDDDYDKTF